MSRSSQIIVVTFDPSTDLDPLTVIEKHLAEQVELYLQRVAAGPIDVALSDSEPTGVAMTDGRPLASFTFAPIGGAR
ncbi:hypothetical protein [Streptomyces sp. NPDC096033]|uniref:hypothetical protein n=1 Tax=Streptomyces sp. NPDC096033 TaxID=3366071 RepID=UPI0037FB22BA